jgi:HEAT repeat protein
LVSVVCALAALASAQVPKAEARAEGRPISEWVAELASSDFQTRRRAEVIVQRSGQDAIPALVAFIDAGDNKARVRGLMQLNWACCDKKEALPLLRRLLGESDMEVAVLAADGIVLVEGGLDDTTLATLREGLKSCEGLGAVFAASTLKRLGPEAAPAVPDLERALSHPNRDVRLVAAHALGRVGPPAAAAIPKLEELAHGADAALRQNAAQALTAIRKQ